MGPHEFMDAVVKAPSDAPFRLLGVHPCANVNVAKYSACSKPGTMACSECRLVSYCSKECQKKHWNAHKNDCRNPMRSKNWKPVWTRENRLPSFVDGPESTGSYGDEISRARADRLSSGVCLWGNSPAIDIVNLSHNENDPKCDLNLAFPASGDLRHAVLTVNNLPENFLGDLKLVINDRAPHVTSRNLVVLLVLGMIQDEALAADIALHFWYSVFYPGEYTLRISAIITSALSSAIKDKGALNVPLGPRSSLSCTSLPNILPFLSHILGPSQNLEEFQTAYDSVRKAPEREDFRDRMYAGLRPSHRVAFQKYRRFGIVLPFGAINAHFNAANHSLFSFDAQWLQTDFADPLGGWETTDVVAAGKKHGTPAEDIYGCLYFYLTDQLRIFVRRLRTHRISIVLCDLDSTALSVAIRQGCLTRSGVPRSIRFNRIHVSNIFDFNYVGLSDVLRDWSGLLGDTKHSVLLGYFMNWPFLQPDGQISGACEGKMRDAMKRLDASGRYTHDVSTPHAAQVSIISMLSVLDTYYDNCKPFLNFLKKQRLDEVLRREKLRLRETHTIVPHRLQVPINARRDALPQFPDVDSWYYYNYVTCSSACERYVEFCRQ
ncbi:hypothetical protein HYPSUDRAFT_43147 [Hypholoma sublateritium FD-334 SS-4]|uniref:MYND-type domain-containing protein n=1 Tax=Hypholoma sublateritium (strain FD-334 SS-4) TaxID=945553 RepID=A0A0D2NV88_HYPSF|nr:hypothetical protein HYPSUDRAFT_43147 [Hypholoma sublateritium FD-334 SS-4]